MSAVHVPVLRDRVLAWLAPTAPGIMVDATVGLGGHAAALLEAAPGLRLVGLDRDPEALERASERLQPFSDRVTLIRGAFAELPALLRSLGCPPLAAVLADLGCSSLQLDSAERGFSFQTSGPLDMRMSRAGATAGDLVNEAAEDELVRVLREYGEERRARRVARAIVAARRRRPIRTTDELARLVAGAVGGGGGHRIHPATRTFQALRIAVNDELGQLERFLEPAARALRPGGRIAIISFHSLEDRIVKHSLRRLAGACVCPPEAPACVCRPERLVEVLTRRAERPGADEVAANPRARSARLRVAGRLGTDP
ncbi:MAG TPA: 16S rRNA (cytosine(1402)-N(4))-methyltransferase RsmH [Thermoanaerobaculales bacterium]|nr:16S rRNA (cytosine(1402)-N(4))-methyltransferase RsmH [Thermoanaerobaculales bacterium]HQL30044.1 16S rRNA (cytosine(1402)-N(4))-methyltransferase RsmH [Thermoanaerobaculales bacterium]